MFFKFLKKKDRGRQNFVRNFAFSVSKHEVGTRAVVEKYFFIGRMNTKISQN